MINIVPNKYMITLKKNMVKEKVSRELTLKNTDERKNYFLEEIHQNDLMSRKHKKTCTTLD